MHCFSKPVHQTSLGLCLQYNHVYYNTSLSCLLELSLSDQFFAWSSRLESSTRRSCLQCVPCVFRILSNYSLRSNNSTMVLLLLLVGLNTISSSTLFLWSLYPDLASPITHVPLLHNRKWQLHAIDFDVSIQLTSPLST
ncbi:hypothetical protein SERLADRAFT_463145 [Serpula lacrymans var. lacrymans S7.9]|uniref:Uncharacterized protein n=1 Tax=Serpula lacrymans var. lacrymans (strain S7.9) TaxID=578457 RepID=F8NRE7_SERL9|nr:uncharacterized protein SERLADRAFT_463145 [Serpula lacrymans var. lacrymans S7.9]EGO26266.1 hypothetical protein SERLADRAFT_463145 [Serpula lacrymans var. lacrymans S7.9]